jgi:hypothetical protein
MCKQSLTKLTLAAAGLCLAPLLSAQDSEIPRTEYGHPDFQGFYTFRTITPLQRPRELENLEVLTPEQAEEWEAYENRRQNRDLIIDSVGGAGYPPGVISYNEFWYERGSETIADRRTSLIYDPPNGRIPSLNEAGQQRRSAYQQMVFESAGPEGRTTVDRCITGFVGGPPMIPGSYNNNMQLVQTEDHVMILNEMVHTAASFPTPMTSTSSRASGKATPLRAGKMTRWSSKPRAGTTPTIYVACPMRRTWLSASAERTTTRWNMISP